MNSAAVPESRPARAFLRLFLKAGGIPGARARARFVYALPERARLTYPSSLSWKLCAPRIGLRVFILPGDAVFSRELGSGDGGVRVVSLSCAFGIRLGVWVEEGLAGS